MVESKIEPLPGHAKTGLKALQIVACEFSDWSNVNMAKKIQESHENMIKALLEGYDSEDTIDGNGQQSNVKLG